MAASRCAQVCDLEALSAELIARTPVGDAWLLASDEADARITVQRCCPVAAPASTTFFLLWARPRAARAGRAQRSELWTTRVWPGALLVNGEIAGVWRRLTRSSTCRHAVSQQCRTGDRGSRGGIPALPGLTARSWFAGSPEARSGGRDTICGIGVARCSDPVVCPQRASLAIGLASVLVPPMTMSGSSIAGWLVC